jgi:hypothetical protein
MTDLDGRITTWILDTKTANKQQMLEKNGSEEKEEMDLVLLVELTGIARVTS